MSKISHYRSIPDFNALPRPVFARNEQWGEQGSTTDWHLHQWGQFSYAIAGVLTVLTEQSRFVAPPQFAIWVPAGIRHQVVSNSATLMRSLYIDPNWLADDIWMHSQVVEVTPLVRELIQQFSQQSPLWDEKSAEQRLAMVLVDQIRQLEAARMQLPMPVDRRLLQLCQFLRNQPDSRVTMAQLACQFGISSRSISRLFVEQTGLSFRQWRQRLRLFHALDLLEQKQSVTEVAFACGYESLSAFVSAFRQLFGLTPGQYVHR
ncbi:helix-turn-helix domain-containing protein [Celerinatantimonas sp. YJH-8]|uniref:AraC family transcriptional regulator n=1 Tax=Celerinatantimonas sp. YJH-8 TaxID=3228714 RepID=UPI0038C393B4